MFARFHSAIYRFSWPSSTLHLHFNSQILFRSGQNDIHASEIFKLCSVIWWPVNSLCLYCCEHAHPIHTLYTFALNINRFLNHHYFSMKKGKNLIVDCRGFICSKFVQTARVNKMGKNFHILSFIDVRIAIANHKYA